MSAVFACATREAVPRDMNQPVQRMAQPRASPGTLIQDVPHMGVVVSMECGWANRQAWCLGWQIS